MSEENEKRTPNPPKRIGSVYFVHPTLVGEDGKKETIFLGSVFENSFDEKDPRKGLALTMKSGEKFLKASVIKYGEGDEAVYVEIPNNAWPKVKIDGGPAAKKAGPEAATPENPDKF